MVLRELGNTSSLLNLRELNKKQKKTPEDYNNFSQIKVFIYFQSFFDNTFYLFSASKILLWGKELSFLAGAINLSSFDMNAEWTNNTEADGGKTP